jgi:uncharacterized protein YifE (UPF0438 family)
MATQGEHSAYLGRTDYTLDENAKLGLEEAALLRRYGHWMEALASGRIQPITPEQAHFVEVAHGEAEPRTDFERAWASLSQRREPPASLFTRLVEARGRAEHLRREKEEEREKIMERVKADLDALDTHYGPELQEAEQELQEAEAALRAEVLLAGKSIKHGSLHAVYCRGRVTWDADGLARLADQTPAILECRRVGAPSVQLRYQREKE